MKNFALIHDLPHQKCTTEALIMEFHVKIWFSYSLKVSRVMLRSTFRWNFDEHLERESFKTTQKNFPPPLAMILLQHQTKWTSLERFSPWREAFFCVSKANPTSKRATRRVVLLIQSKLIFPFNLLFSLQVRFLLLQKTLPWRSSTRHPFEWAGNNRWT